jgi:hypothetical protein
VGFIDADELGGGGVEGELLGEGEEDVGDCAVLGDEEFDGFLCMLTKLEPAA